MTAAHADPVSPCFAPHPALTPAASCCELGAVAAVEVNQRGDVIQM